MLTPGSFLQHRQAGKVQCHARDACECKISSAEAQFISAEGAKKENGRAEGAVRGGFRG